jgi:predicted Zn-dependent protease
LDELVGQGEEHTCVELGRCQILFHEGERAEALAGMRNLANAASPTSEFYPAALAFFLNAGAPDDANQIVERLRTNPPGNPSSLADCIMTLDKAGRKAEARELHASAARRYPNVAVLKVLDAGSAADDGDLPRAMRLFREVPPNMRPRIGIWPFVKGFIGGLFGGKPP